MITLDLEYDPERHYCKVSSDSEDWELLRRSLSEFSSDSEVSLNTVSLPISDFIGNIKNFNYLIKRYGAKCEYDEILLEQIKKASERRKKYLNLDKSIVLSEDKVQSELDQKSFKRRLKSYQRRNVSNLLRLNSGATFSVPGAGKTTEALAYFTLKRINEKLLVICPKIAFPAWEEQISECLEGDSLRCIRLTHGYNNIKKLINESDNYDVFLITYQQYVLVTNLISRLLDKHDSYVFLDESHRIKGGENSKTGREIQRIAHLPVGKLIMSGTPLPNSARDLVSQFKFLFPEIEAVDETTVVDKIQPIYVRTTKRELGLKDPVRQLTKIGFNEPQKNLYELSRNEELRKAQGISRTDKNYLRSLGKSYMRMLQIVSNPALLMKSSYEFPDALREVIEFGDSAKINYTLKRSRELASQGKKVLIWSGFVENVELISRRLQDIGADYLHGGVESGSEDEDNTREQKVKRFHDDESAMVLVANPAACSEGISLHKICHHAIYVDRNYNAAQFLQSMDRIHRLGLDPDIDTTIEILHTPESIDENIETRLSNKIKRMASVLNDDSLHVEAEEVDLDETGFNEVDAEDFLKHLQA